MFIDEINLISVTWKCVCLCVSVEQSWITVTPPWDPKAAGLFCINWSWSCRRWKVRQSLIIISKSIIVWVILFCVSLSKFSIRHSSFSYSLILCLPLCPAVTPDPPWLLLTHLFLTLHLPSRIYTSPLPVVLWQVFAHFFTLLFSPGSPACSLTPCPVYPHLLLFAKCK